MELKGKERRVEKRRKKSWGKEEIEGKVQLVDAEGEGEKGDKEQDPLTAKGETEKRTKTKKESNIISRFYYGKRIEEKR